MTYSFAENFPNKVEEIPAQLQGRVGRPFELFSDSNGERLAMVFAASLKPEECGQIEANLGIEQSSSSLTSRLFGGDKNRWGIWGGDPVLKVSSQDIGITR